MTMLGDTEFGAIRICARSVQVLDKVGFLTLNKEDDAAVVLARNELLSVIQETAISWSTTATAWSRPATATSAGNSRADDGDGHAQGKRSGPSARSSSHGRT